MTTHWFRQTLYGYGAKPVSREGWTLSAASVANGLTLVWVLKTFDRHSPLHWLALVVISLVAGILWMVSRRKTEEWRRRSGGE